MFAQRLKQREARCVFEMAKVACQERQAFRNGARSYPPVTNVIAYMTQGVTNLLRTCMQARVCLNNLTVFIHSWREVELSL